jgi:hypothetical protein
MIRSNAKLLIFLLSGFVLLMLAGCASKRYVRQAVKYEQAEMYRQAVDNYVFSLRKKFEKNDDARIGLMRAAKRYGDELESKINDAYTALQDNLVVTYFLELQNLQQKAAEFKVDFDVSHKARGQFDEAKIRHLRVTYTKAQEALDKEQFSEAERLFQEVMSIDRNYERAIELHAFAVCEPIYREGRKYFDGRLYRSAYFAFGRLLKVNPTYKDAASLQKEALQYAVLTVAIQPFKQAYTYPFLASEIEQMTKQEFAKQNDPLLKVVSTDYTRRMLEEQRLALQHNLPFDASLVIPIRMFLSGDIKKSAYIVSKINKTERKAFLRYEDRNRQQKFKKVYYLECSQTAHATIQFGYEFIRVENSIVVAADVIEKNYTDKVVYASSEYDSRDLFPGDWGDGKRDTMYTDQARLNSMRQLFDARSVLTDKASFEQNFASVVALEMFKKIRSYDPEK